jgi:hypothetical protein
VSKKNTKKWTQTDIVSISLPIYVIISNCLFVAFTLWLATAVKTALVAMGQVIVSISLAVMFCRYPAAV